MITQNQYTVLVRRAEHASCGEDEVQDALEETTRYWKPDGGASFWTLAWRNLNHRISRALRDRKRGFDRRTRVYLEPYEQHKMGVTMMTTTADQDRVSELADEWGQTLAPGDRDIWLLCMNQDLNQSGNWAVSEVARELNTSRQRVHARMKVLLPKFLEHARGVIR
jgi:DNA-directed RNA polymerase specialized sigma24 family protein